MRKGYSYTVPMIDLLLPRAARWVAPPAPTMELRLPPVPPPAPTTDPRLPDPPPTMVLLLFLLFFACFGLSFFTERIVEFEDSA